MQPDATAPSPGVRLADGALGAAVTAALVVVIATAPDPARPPDLLAYAFAVALGAVLLLRRRMPRAVLVLSALATFAYYTFDYPPIGVAVPMLAALFSAAEAGLLLWPIGTAVAVYVVSTVFRVRDGVEPLGTLLGYESVSNLALFAAAIAVGHTVRAHRVLTAQRRRIDALTSAQLRRETDLLVRSERGRISRELHDTIGHTLSVVALHAAVADEAIGRDDGAATQAVGRIRDASRESLAELRSAVGLLREGDDDGPDVLASLTAVEDLAAAARDAGLRVDVEVDADDVARLPSLVDAAAYRVVQESLTNVLRHAHGTRATVSARLADDLLVVRVADDGHGGGPTDDAGSGLKGMAERVRLLGGTLSAARAGTGGFVVEATLPVRRDR